MQPNQGSRLGNSLLLQFTEKELGSVFAGSTSRGLAAAASGLEPPAKKKKVAGRMGERLRDCCKFTRLNNVLVTFTKACPRLLELVPGIEVVNMPDRAT